MIDVYLVSITYSVIYLFLTLGLATLDILTTPLRIWNYLAATSGRPQDFVIARLCYLLLILLSGLLFWFRDLFLVTLVYLL